MKNNNLDSITINKLLKQVKQNKKYKSISDDIVEKEIYRYIRKYQSDQEDIYNEKFALKKIRKELHRLYSSYQTKGKRKRNIYLEELKNIINKKNQGKQELSSQVSDITNKLLSTMLSTKERLNYYPTIYQKIFEITGKPEKIIDLGSGINPISFPYMRLDNLNYYAYDIDNEDIKFLNDYFNIMKSSGLNGKAEILDITDLDKIKKFHESDIIFIFKLIDLIDQKSKKKKKISEELIKILINKTKFIVVSFPTKTLTRKSMKLPKRIGFEKMLSRNQLNFKMIQTNNEVFYVVFK